MLEQFWARMAENVMSGSRSTVLKPLLTIDGLLLGALVLTGATEVGGAPSWIVVFVASCFCLSLVLTLGAYVFFALRDPDALRSEKYSLQKMAIERGVVGDNLAGIIPDAARRSLTENIQERRIGREQGQ